MPQKVTQENIHLFIPAKVGKIVSRMERDMKIDLKEALLAFYRSPVYRMLETESTKLWYDSGEQIYEEYQIRLPERIRKRIHGTRRAHRRAEKQSFAQPDFVSHR